MGTNAARAQHRRQAVALCLASSLLALSLAGTFGSAARADDPGASDAAAPGPRPAPHAADFHEQAAPEGPAPAPPEVLSGEAQLPPPPGYQLAIDQAIDEHERGHFEEARTHFREAHEVFPNARTLRGLGKVEFELRNYGESVKFLAASLSSTVRPLSEDLRLEVETLLERARAYVGEVHVNVQPGSASVSVDGVTVASGPQAALALLVGEHVLEFRANGRVSERRLVRIKGREQINVQVVLAPPDSGALKGHRPSGERPSGQPPLYRKWWLWTAVGVVAAGAATALALSLREREPRTRELESAAGAWVVVNP